MKKLFYGIHAFLVIAALSACDGPKNTKTQSSTTKATETSVETPVTSASIDTSKANAHDAEREKKKTQMSTGTASLDNILDHLREKLGLSGAQYTSVKGIITKSFLASGRELEKQYNFEESRVFKQEIIRSSSDEIMNTLDPTQQEKFKKLMSRQ